MAQWTAIKTIFGQFCIDKFGETDGELIYEIYYNIIKFDIKHNKYKSHRDQKIEMQKDHINYLLSQVSKETFLQACKKIKLDNESGSLPEIFKKASSFRNFVLKFNPDYNPGNKTEATIQKEIIEIKQSIPIRHIKIDDTYSGDNEFLNYYYKCSECGQVFDGWSTQCINKNCNAIIQWKKL